MRAALRIFGELAITAGLVLALFCAYLVWGTGVETARHQRVLEEQLLLEPVRPTPLEKIELGRALALIHIPRLGDDYRYAVVEGVDAGRLKMGPGHYPGTALPGQVGNFVISGHRTTYAAPFRNINRLRLGDEIVIDAREARYTYRVTAKKIVAPHQLEVIAPVPGEPGRRPTEAMITLTTCHPEYSARQRLIVFGRLANTEKRKV